MKTKILILLLVASLNLFGSNPTYSIQIGVYKGTIPTDILNKYLDLKENIKQKSSINGYTIFLIGNYKSYSLAKKREQEIINIGIENALIIKNYTKP